MDPEITSGKCFVADGVSSEAQWLMVDLGEPAVVFMITIYNSNSGYTGESKCALCF